MSAALWFALVCASLAIVYGFLASRWVLAKPTGNERMREIAAAIQEGAQAYLARQYGGIDRHRFCHRFIMFRPGRLYRNEYFRARQCTHY